MTTYQLIDYIDSQLSGKVHNIYASNEVPSDRVLKALDDRYIILNTDNSSGRGIHWVVLYMRDGNIYYHDPLGDPFTKQAIWRKRDWINTDNRPEQDITTDFCGNHVLAWMETVDKFGIDRVKNVL